MGPFVCKTDTGVIVWRGTRPVCHAALRADHVTHRIDLQSGVYETLHEDQLEQENPADFGIKLLDLDLSDFSAPTYTQAMKVIECISMLPKGSKVYIHCLHGKDRTGFICACLRVANGASIKSAVKEMLEYGFHKIPYLMWLPSLYRVLRRIQLEGTRI